MIEQAERKAPSENLAYGESVYWMTLVASLVVLIGSVVAFVSKANFIPVSYWISAVWDGKSTEDIWHGAGSTTPPGHWYIDHLMTGDGLQALGLSIAVFSILLGMGAAAFILFRKRNMIFGAFASVAAAIIIISMLIESTIG